MFLFKEILLPFVFGILLVGAVTQRTLEIIKGEVLRTALASVLISGIYWFNIQYVVEKQFASYCAFGAGTLVITCLIAYREKIKKQEHMRTQRNSS